MKNVVSDVRSGISVNHGYPKELSELMLMDLKHECEEQEIATSGTKFELVQRLREYLHRASEDPRPCAMFCRTTLRCCHSKWLQCKMESSSNLRVTPHNYKKK